MSLYISETDFLNSFDGFQKKQAKQYLLAKQLFKTIKNKSEVGRLLKIPKTTIGYWLCDTTKPIAIQQMNFLKSIGLLPLVESNNENFVFFVELFAFLFGNGHLHKNIQTSNFCGEIDDLKKIQSKLKQLFVLGSRIYSMESIGKVTKVKNNIESLKTIEGHSNILWLSSSALNRLFFVAGAPAGDKVKSDVILPNWIVNSSLNIKKHFLGVLFGNELQCPYLKTKGAFTSPQLGFHKIESKSKMLKQLLNQIREMLSDFGIRSSGVKMENSQTLRSRDNKYSRKYYFFLYSNPKNILKLFNQIPFIYARDKARKFKNTVINFLNVNKSIKFDWEIYKQAIQLNKTGLGHVRIFKKLNLPQKYLYKLNYWLYYDKKPKYFDSKKEILSCWYLIL